MLGGTKKLSVKIRDTSVNAMSGSKFLWAVTKVDRASNHVYGQFNKELVCETCKIICLPHKSDDCRKYHENLILLTRFNCDHAVIK